MVADDGGPDPDRGVLVAFEGIDGSGKTTAARRVHAALEADGLPVHLTREPTDTPLGRRVREAIRAAGEVHPVAQALLFMADHRAHVADVRSRLAEGVHVLSDRWNDSCYAYQWATLEMMDDPGLVDDPLAWLERGMGGPDEDLRPDLVVLLDVDPETAISRLDGRGDGPEDAGFERLELLERVRENYHALAERFGGYAVVDGSGGEDEVAEACLEAVRAVL